MDIDGFRDTAVWAALIAFNLPILAVGTKIVMIPQLDTTVGKALKEKDDDGNSTDATSYSRVTGAVGAVMMACLFWVISNIVIVVAILDPKSVSDILSSVGKLFLVGAAMFLPYVFNQLKSVL